MPAMPSQNEEEETNRELALLLEVFRTEIQELLRLAAMIQVNIKGDGQKKVAEGQKKLQIALSEIATDEREVEEKVRQHEQRHESERDRELLGQDIVKVYNELKEVRAIVVEMVKLGNEIIAMKQQNQN